MRVAIDGQTFASPDADRGIGVYLRLLLDALAAARPGEFELLRWSPRLAGLPPEGVLPTFRLGPSISPGNRHGEAEFHERNAAVRQHVREHGCDLLFNPNPLQTSVQPLSRPGSVPLVATVHDLTPLALGWGLLGLEHTDIPARYELRLQHLRHHADHIVADSEATRRDVIEKLGFPPDKVSVVYPGVAPVFCETPGDTDVVEAECRNIEALKRIRGRYLLVVGGYNPKKNFDGLLAGLGRVSPSHRRLPVVFAGPIGDTEWQSLEALSLRHCPGVEILQTGQVSDPELAALYRNALALLFVSLHEGFGFPIVEAMACGCPVITSSASSMPEIAGDAAQLCDPRSPESIAAALDAVLGSQDLRDTMRQRGLARAQCFTWNKAAADTAAVFENCLGRKPAAAGSSPRRDIAWLSPLPPVTGGVSAYSRALLEDLVEHFDVTLVTDQSSVELPAVLSRLRRIAPAEYAGGALPHSLPVYNMGNNVEQCAGTFHALVQRPGLTIVHDLNIHGFLLDHVVRGRCSKCRDLLVGDMGGHPYEAALKTAHGTRGEREAARVLAKGDLPDIPGLPCHRVLTAHSLATICHSAWAQRELEANGDPGPVYHLPLGIEYPLMATEAGIGRIRLRFGLDGKEPLFVCAGFLEPSRRLESVLHAARALAERGIPSRLLFAGPISKDHQDYILRVAAALSIRERLVITGKIADDDGFLACLQAADAVIHLRHPTNGETSATVRRALALGRPVLVSDCDAYRELPDDCCWKVDVGDLEVPLLTEYMATLVERPGLRARMARNAQRYIETVHAWPRVAPRFCEVIRDVLSLAQHCS